MRLAVDRLRCADARLAEPLETTVAKQGPAPVRRDADPQPDAIPQVQKKRGLARFSRSSPQQSLGEEINCTTFEIVHHPNR